jgi:hypothetical protein
LLVFAPYSKVNIVFLSIEETDPQFLNKLQQNGLDPYLMNKEQIEKQYLLWNRGQRPTSLTTDGGVSFGNEFVR